MGRRRTIRRRVRFGTGPSLSTAWTHRAAGRWCRASRRRCRSSVFPTEWFQDIQETEPPKILTCAPRTPSDVAAVCNWARQNGYKVRPRGILHGWSPLSLPTAPIEQAKVLLVDLTKGLWQTTFLPASGGLSNRVKVGAGATL